MFSYLRVGSRNLVSRHKTVMFSTLKKSHKIKSGMAAVHIVPVLQDNYSYIVVENHTGIATVVDPGEFKPVYDEVQKLERSGSITQLKYILCTHRHADHIDGNSELLQKYPSIEILGPGYEPIPGITRKLYGGENIQIGDSINVNVLHTPCHTKGHLCFHLSPSTTTATPPPPPSSTVTSPTFLFAGDTLFAGGCGRFFEGSASDMLANMDKLGTLPDDTLVFCGHEYTLSNLKFLQSIDEKNTTPYYETAKHTRSEFLPTVPTTIGAELKYNLFMKCREEYTWGLVGASNAEEAMHNLREMKNKF